MNEERVGQIVRNFPENGLKQVLTTSANVRDLLTLAKASMLPRLDRTVMKVQELTSDERQRRQELLSYIDAAVYYWRGRSEHAFLRQRIDAALKNDEARLEMEMIRKTMAQAEAERYTLEANKRTLVKQLRLRFSSLPAEVEQTIENTQDAGKLAEWLNGVITAKDLDSIGILPSR
jgi:hypothetical protein